MLETSEVQRILQNARISAELSIGPTPDEVVEANKQNIENLLNLVQGPTNLLLSRMEMQKEIFQDQFLSRLSIEPVAFRNAISDHVDFSVRQSCSTISSFVEAPKLSEQSRTDLENAVKQLQLLDQELQNIDVALFTVLDIEELRESIKTAISDGAARLRQQDQDEESKDDAHKSEATQNTRGLTPRKLLGKLLARQPKPSSAPPASRPQLREFTEPEAAVVQGEVLPTISEADQVLLQELVKQSEIEQIYILLCRDQKRSDYQQALVKSESTRVQILNKITSQVGEIVSRANSMIDAELPLSGQYISAQNVEAVYSTINLDLGITATLDRLRQLKETIGLDTSRQQDSLRGIRENAVRRKTSIRTF